VNPPYVAEQIVERFGRNALAQLEGTGRTFDQYFS
jgi:hypothetical protein